VQVQREPGGTEFESLDNPVLGRDLTAWVERLGGALACPVVSLTGGEPLLHADFLTSWLAPLQGRFEFLLETHGLLPGAAEQVVPLVSEVVADIKLPSATGEAVDWELHRSFLQVVRKASVALTWKAVVSAETTEQELEHVLELFEQAGERASLILQPVSPVPGGPPTPTLASLLKWQSRGIVRGLDIRVMPQVHKFMEIL
jgi:organic radical activating enzyme